MTKAIIEHLEPRLWKWSLVEYRHISRIVGKENLVFTNIKTPKSIEKLSVLGKVFSQSVRELKLGNACILDPSADRVLKNEDNFDYLVFGGILGDFPRKRRTKKQISDRVGFPVRNLGKCQMSTDTAVYVAWKIIQGMPLEKIKFKKRLVIKIREGEEIILPYKFAVEDNHIVLAEGYIDLIKRAS